MTAEQTIIKTESAFSISRRNSGTYPSGARIMGLLALYTDEIVEYRKGLINNTASPSAAFSRIGGPTTAGRPTGIRTRSVWPTPSVHIKAAGAPVLLSHSGSHLIEPREAISAN